MTVRTKPGSVGEAVQNIRSALKKTFPEVKFLVKRVKKPGYRVSNVIFVGWYEGQGVTVNDVETISKAFHDLITCTTWFNDGSF